MTRRKSIGRRWNNIYFDIKCVSSVFAKWNGFER